MIVVFRVETVFSFCREAGPVTPLSSAAWSMSFAKYLDLRFHSRYRRSGTSCHHSLHRDHFQFFAFGHTVAAFKLAPIKIREISSPSTIISVSDDRCLPDRHELIEVVKVVAVKGHNVFATITECLNTFQNFDLEKLDDRLQSLMGICRTDKQLFKDRLECLQVRKTDVFPIFVFRAALLVSETCVIEKKKPLNISYFILFRYWQLTASRVCVVLKS